MSLTNRLKAITLLPVLATALITGYNASAQQRTNRAKVSDVTSYCQQVEGFSIKMPSGQVIKSCDSFNKYVKSVKKNYSRANEIEVPIERFSRTHEHFLDRKLTDAFTKLKKPYLASVCVPENYKTTSPSGVINHSRAKIRLFPPSKNGEGANSKFPFIVRETEEAARQDCRDWPEAHQDYNNSH